MINTKLFVGTRSNEKLQAVVTNVFFLLASV